MAVPSPAPATAAPPFYSGVPGMPHAIVINTASPAPVASFTSAVPPGSFGARASAVPVPSVSPQLERAITKVLSRASKAS